jgi:methylated-DNA-[protein]-cysteine S-methyltransferase
MIKIIMEHFFYNSPLGTLLLREKDGFLTELCFHNSLVTDASDLPGTSVVPESALLNKCLEQLDHYFSGKNLHFSIPLKQTGTMFQEKVWQELLKIAPGQTISYMQLSKRLGDVKAIRAVGTANGKNTVAIIVPCHRVIGSNGDLVGYGGELWRKKWLLDHEAKYSNGVQTLF